MQTESRQFRGRAPLLVTSPCTWPPATASHCTQDQLARLSQLAETEGIGEAVLLREALDDLLRKYAL